MMEKEILKFPLQFQKSLKVENQAKIKPFKKILWVGMGGSGLAGDLVKLLAKDIQISTWKDFNLPQDLDSKTLLIFSSYSGNTQETLSGFEIALKKKLNLAIVSSGGKLLKEAQAKKLPLVEIPEKNIPPRMALGYSLTALLKLAKRERELKELKTASKKVNPESLRKEGKKLAKKLFKKVVLIYSSQETLPLAYIFKVNFQETGKSFAFLNFFPELLHNEIQSFENKTLSKKLFFILLLERDKDTLEIKKRINVFKNIFEKEGFQVEKLKIKDSYQSLIESLILAFWTGFYLAKLQSLDPKKISLIERFKEHFYGKRN